MLRPRRRHLSPVLTAITGPAQPRLQDRCRRLLGRRPAKPEVVMALGREVPGFSGAIGVPVERQPRAAATV